MGIMKRLISQRTASSIGHHTFHLTIISEIFSTDYECHSHYAQDDPTVASQNKEEEILISKTRHCEYYAVYTNYL